MFLAESEINPQVIIVFVAMIFAGLKALYEKMQAAKQQPPVEEADEDYDPYLEYEEVLERQRQELGFPPVVIQKKAPPPLPREEIFVQPALPKVKRPVLTAEEKQALQNLNIPSNRRKHSGITTKSRLKSHLSSPTAAREALLLSEILGPPKSMK